MLTGEDYDEMRQARGGRGRVQGGQKSWRYSREDEDRDVAAAMKASMATRRQEERVSTQDRGSMHERGGGMHERGGGMHERGGGMYERGGMHERGGGMHERGGGMHERGGG
ncbi:glycine-rich protein 3-like, partial [Notothenia coriiceps]|uniref:Glycine-rich protein 3-like n=1 Tax=Notothenia coriiceps TaxID=8208 RepID=A0A6I9Q5F7_9TELE